MENKSGWEQDKRYIFNDIVDNYHIIRPEYPKELFIDILSYTNPQTGKIALEIGSGTGKATYPFIEAGYKIQAVEINKNMANFLSMKFKDKKNLYVINDSFENVNLENIHFNLIYSASAFHWVDEKIACPKAFSLLKEGGVLALFRYHALANYTDPIFNSIQEAYEKHYYSYYIKSKRPVRKTKEYFLKASEVYRSFKIKDLKDYGFKDITNKFYNETKEFTADQYIMLLDTMSDHRSLPETNRDALYEDIREIVLEHGNSHKVEYIFQLYMGRK